MAPSRLAVLASPLLFAAACAAAGPATLPAPQPPAAPAAPAPAQAGEQNVSPPAAPRCESRDLETCIRAIIDEPPLQRTTFGVEVYDPRADREIVGINADKHFIPASNEKLLTTSAAMAVLGPDYHYDTVVQAPGLDAGTGEARALVVRGSGDPTFSKRFGAEELAVLDSLADSAWAAGVRHVAGPLIIDASRFDSTLVNGSWEVGDLDWYYAAPVAAFGASEGAIPLRYGPGAAPGEPARFAFLGPEGMVHVVDHVATVASDSARWDVHRAPGDTLLLTGTIDAGRAPDTTWIAVEDPAAYAGRALLLALRRRGIAVDGGLRVVFDTAVAHTLTGTDAPVVADWRSPPLAAIVKGLLEPSQNWIAEQLLKTLGAEATGQGSWRSGTRVVRDFLDRRVGIDSLAIRMEDGSGLSAQDLVTPRALVRLLTWDRAEPWGQQYLDALAAPGEEESTMEHRLLAYEGRIFAKTGTISNVNSLSGFVITDAGRELVFSILSNGSGLPSSQVRAAIDRIIEIVAAQGGSK